MKSTQISKILAREILDSRGNPTVETTIWAGEIWATASVPSGASTGIHEALELRDGDKKRYGGLGVLNACKNVNTKIAKVLKGFDVTKQREIDEKMIVLDKTKNKSKLGANAILSVSLASARLAAKIEGLELYEYLAKVYRGNGNEVLPTKIKYTIPTPLFNVINGGVHADSGLDIQEFFIIPQTKKFSNQLEAGVLVYHQLKKNLMAEGYSIGVGDEGGFAPKLPSNEDALKYLAEAVKKSGFVLGKDFNLGMDAASSEFYDKSKATYELKASKTSLKSASIYQFYKKWINKYSISVIEDGCAEDDFLGWKFLTQNLGQNVLLVGDDLFVTNSKRIQMGINQKIANSVLIKVNQIGSLSETFDAIKLAQQNNYKVILSHRSGETPDSFIADLSVAVNADYIKAGAPCRGERLAKYNRLLEIEEKI
jgi:enolase